MIVLVKESLASKMSLEPGGCEGHCCLKKQEHWHRATGMESVETQRQGCLLSEGERHRWDRPHIMVKPKFYVRSQSGVM